METFRQLKNRFKKRIHLYTSNVAFSRFQQNGTTYTSIKSVIDETKVTSLLNDSNAL